MKTPWLTLALLLANCFLALGLRHPGKAVLAESQPTNANANLSAISVIDRPKTDATKRPPETPFQAIYSSNIRQFGANLRAIGCPEQTVKDILTAEIDRRYAPQEEALRPKPAD